MKTKFVALLAAALTAPLAAQEQSPAPQQPAAQAPAEENFDIRDFRAATVPMVAMPLDMSQRSDPIWVRGERPANNRIASLTLRPAEAVVVEQDLGQGAGGSVVLQLAITGWTRGLVTRAGLAEHHGERLYCADGLSGANTGKVLCLIDQDQDGRFESQAFGAGETQPEVRQLSVVGKAQPLPAPVPYRAAREEEIPTVTALVSNCARDHDRPRYTFTVQGDGATLRIEDLLRGLPAGSPSDPIVMRQIMEQLARRSRGAECQAAERVRAGDPLYPTNPERDGAVARLGELVIAVGPKNSGANVRLLGLRNPDRLYRITGISVAPLSETVTPRQNELAIAQRYNRPVIMLAGEPEVNEGPRGVGDVILSAPIRHGYMGVLTQNTTIRTLLSSRSLAAGTTLYGIPMSTRRVTTINGIPTGGSFNQPDPTVNDVRLTWCVPVEDEGRWTATCLPRQEGRYTILRGQRPAFEVRSFSYDAGTTTNPGEVPVEEREGDFGQPLLYVFRLKSVADGEIVITQETSFGGRVVNSRDHHLGRMPGRESGFAFGGGVLALGAAPDGRLTIRRVAPFRQGSDVMTVNSGIVRAPAEAEAAPPVPVTP